MIRDLPNTLENLHAVDSSISISATSCTVLATCTGRAVFGLYQDRAIVVRPLDCDALTYIIELRTTPCTDVRYEPYYDPTIAEYTAETAVFPVRDVMGISCGRGVALRVAREVPA
jgi:hypothetical protein